MSARYERAIRLLREHEPKGSTAILAALEQLYEDTATREVKLFELLQREERYAAIVARLDEPEPESADQPEPVKRTATPAEQDERLAHWLYRVIDTLAPVLPHILFVGYVH